MRRAFLTAILVFSLVGCDEPAEEEVSTPAEQKSTSKKSGKKGKGKPGKNGKKVKTDEGKPADAEPKNRREMLAWVERKGIAGEPGLGDLGEPPQLQESGIAGDGFTIRMPIGWAPEPVGSRLLMTAPHGGTGVAPRVVAFVTSGAHRDEVRDKAQMKQVLEELTAVHGVDALEVLERMRLKKRSEHAEQTLITRFQQDGQPIMTMRRVVIRGELLYCAFAFAHEKEFETLRGLFERSLKSLKPTD